MGFRTTMITEDINLKIPDSIVDKYPGYNFQENNLPISTKFERKFYGLLKEEELFIDLQKFMHEQDIDRLPIVLLHECGGITKVDITKNSILAAEPTGWKNVDNVEHHYCYGCSEIN